MKMTNDYLTDSVSGVGFRVSATFNKAELYASNAKDVTQKNVVNSYFKKCAPGSGKRKTNLSGINILNRHFLTPET
jgi:hypothetical protein